jgi:hypothetical protein
MALHRWFRAWSLVSVKAPEADRERHSLVLSSPQATRLRRSREWRRLLAAVRGADEPVLLRLCWQRSLCHAVRFYASCNLRQRSVQSGPRGGAPKRRQAGLEGALASKHACNRATGGDSSDGDAAGGSRAPNRLHVIKPVMMEQRDGGVRGVRVRTRGAPSAPEVSARGTRSRDRVGGWLRAAGAAAFNKHISETAMPHILELGARCHGAGTLVPRARGPFQRLGAGPSSAECFPSLGHLRGGPGPARIFTWSHLDPTPGSDDRVDVGEENV